MLFILSMIYNNISDMKNQNHHLPSSPQSNGQRQTQLQQMGQSDSSNNWSSTQKQGSNSPLRYSQNPLKLVLLFIGIVSAALIIYHFYPSNQQQQINHDKNKISTQDKQQILIKSAPQEQYKFLVYCSQYYNKNRTKQSSENDELRRLSSHTQKSSNNQLTLQDKDLNRTYRVTSNSTIQSERLKLQYCGLTRNFYQTCETAEYRCSSPGPMFDISPSTDGDNDHHIDVIWVNALNASIVFGQIDKDCMNATFKKQNLQYCTLMSKVNRVRTYSDPTSVMGNMTEMLISLNNWPNVAHLHGAQVRPTFDGNPLSWIDNQDQSNSTIGTGSLSFEDTCYYETFNSIDLKTNQSLLPSKLNFNQIAFSKKTNRYPNLQNPGMLWYHDHAMHLTNFNVRNGLSGFYILRNPKVQDQIKQIIGHDYNQYLIMLTKTSISMSIPSNSSLTHGNVHRFKILNNEFSGGKTYNFTFSYDPCINKTGKLQKFTIIGADSSLFDQSIDNQTSFIISNGQRLQILIVFSKQKDLYICGSDLASTKGYEANTRISFSKNLKIVDPPQRLKQSNLDITNITLDVPFTNFRLIDDSEISVKRMRPLIQYEGLFTINGRSSFHKGRSDKPTIGTIQDWFMINTMALLHPIHIHLINFQVINSYDLRRITTSKNTNCSIYELDYIIHVLRTSKNTSKEQKNLFNDTFNHYNQICDNKFIIYKNHKQDFDNIFPEDFTDQNRISGMNVLAKLSFIHKNSLENLNVTPPIHWNKSIDSAWKQKIYVVINQADLITKPHYRKWKDTAFVDKFKVLQYRIRWAKSDYNEAIDKPQGRYFNVPADQLIQYPGYVYHCHILGHEDNEMMRPIMLQLPPDYNHLNRTKPCNYDNKKPILKWEDKYICINKHCNVDG